MYCQQCGKEIINGSKFCYGCGAKVSDEIETSKSKEENSFSSEYHAKNTKKPYQKYCPQIKKMSIWSLIQDSLIILAVLMFVFVPIYTRTYEPSLEDIESFEQFGEAIQNGGELTENFSLFDDVMGVVDFFYDEEKEGGLFDKIDSTKSDSEKSQGVFMAMVPAAELAFAVFVLSCSFLKTIKHFKEIQETDKTAMSMYNNVEHAVKNKNKNNINAFFLKEDSNYYVFAFPVFIIGDIFFTAIGSLEEFTVSIRKIQDFSGISIFGYLSVIVLGCIIAACIVRKKKSQALLQEIMEEICEKG